MDSMDLDLSDNSPVVFLADSSFWLVRIGPIAKEKSRRFLWLCFRVWLKMLFTEQF
jgi:hypothetical protein